MATKYISQAEAARRLKVCRERVRQFILEKRLPHIVIAGYRVIPAAALERFAKIPRPEGRKSAKSLEKRRRKSRVSATLDAPKT